MYKAAFTLSVPIVCIEYGRERIIIRTLIASIEMITDEASNSSPRIINLIGSEKNATKRIIGVRTNDMYLSVFKDNLAIP